jgi:hypothetical protein
LRCGATNKNLADLRSSAQHAQLWLKNGGYILAKFFSSDKKIRKKQGEFAFISSIS